MLVEPGPDLASERWIGEQVGPVTAAWYAAVHDRHAGRAQRLSQGF